MAALVIYRNDHTASGRMAAFKSFICTTVSIDASVEQITEYDYDDVMTVTAPENADEYVGMNLGDLFG